MNYDVDNLDARLAQIERKLDELNAYLASSDGRARRTRSGGTRADRTFWGIFLVVLGALWLAERMEWIDISGGWLWPTLLLGFGLYLILGRSER